MEKTVKSPFIIGGFATLIACLLCCFTASFMLYKDLSVNSYVQTEAIVVDHEYITSSDEGMFYDVIQFTVDGKTYTKVALNNRAYYREPLNIGETIVVYYNPDNPDDVIFKSSSHVVMIVVCYLVAAGCAVGSAFLFIKLCKILKKEREYNSRLNLWVKDENDL